MVVVPRTGTKGKYQVNPASWVLATRWGRIVCDEAQFLKNLMSKRNDEKVIAIGAAMAGGVDSMLEAEVEDFQTFFAD